MPFITPLTEEQIQDTIEKLNTLYTTPSLTLNDVKEVIERWISIEVQEKIINRLIGIAESKK